MTIYQLRSCNGERGRIPLGFMFSEDLPLGMIANDLDVDEAPKVKLL
jgi:hypothetical protein